MKTFHKFSLLMFSVVFLLSSCEAENPMIQHPKILELDLDIENQYNTSYTIKKNGVEQSSLSFEVQTDDTVIVSVVQDCWGDCGIISLVSKINDQNISTDFCSCPLYYKQIFVE